ncbi:E3 ubiquitin-protein ligase TRIM71-like [Saccoglossus kowalevskii]|uniref:Tripartite motif-containing protein 2-like n=1 Tax=Saccoglossus kowalevskii TaxID=10224 RepID=A0ABM0GN56_SACKO|nr:PREDICTED: tripartite motif-containing protein 2-like [Saccoglossus kowalevskii]
MAASTIFSEICDQFLRCKLCEGDFNSPKLLPCLHSFCRNCLDGLLKSDSNERSLNCPVCKQYVSLYGKHGVDGLRDNEFIASLTETMGMLQKIRNPVNAIVCTCCSDGNEAKSYCPACDDFLCDDCVGAHGRLKVFKNHASVLLDDIRSGKCTECLLKHDKTQVCKVHDGEVMRFYCKTCEKQICRDCTVLDHKEPDHRYHRLCDAISECREALKKNLSEVKMKISLVNNSLKAVAKSQNEIAQGKEKTIEKIHLEAEKRVDDITNMRIALEGQVNALSSIKERQLNDLKDMLDLELLKLNGSFEFTDIILKMGIDRDILAGKTQMERRLKELAETCVEANMVVDTAVKFIGSYATRATDPLGKVVDESGTTVTVDGPLKSNSVQYSCRLLFEFGKRGSGPGEFCDPEGVAVTNAGDIVVADKGNSRLQIFDSLGNYKFQSPAHMYKTPTDVAVNPDNDFVVVDYGLRCIRITSPDKCHVTIRKTDSSDSPKSPVDDDFWNYLHGITVDRIGHVVVSSSCHEQSHIRVFTPYGTEICRIGEKDKLDRIFYMCTDSSNENILVSNHGKRPLRKYDIRGREIWSTNLPGHFITGICCDDLDNMLTVSYRTGQILLVHKDGTPGGILAEGLSHPEGIAFTKDKKLVVVDGGHNRVKVYQYRRTGSNA